MNVQQYISDIISNSIKALELGAVKIEIEKPANSDFGDYSSNVAMVAIGSQKQSSFTKASQDREESSKIDFTNPRELASKLVELIESELNGDKSVIEKVEIAGPGFINFYLSKEFLITKMGEIIQKDGDVVQQINQGQKVVVEFTDPNPFKEFHIGHLYSNTVGESIARLYEVTGAEVWRADFFGDVGMHVAKSIWGVIEKLKAQSSKPKDLIQQLEQMEDLPMAERAKFLGSAYALGATGYKDDEQAQVEIKQINFLVFKAAQDEVLPTFDEQPQIDFDQFIDWDEIHFDYDQIKQIYLLGRKWSLEYFESIYQRVGMHFDGYYPESRTGEFGYGMTMKGLEKGIFEKGENGAIIYPGEKHGLHNRVFINALGLPTYETKDFGNAVAKQKDFPNDLSVIVTGNEINEYFKVLISALKSYDQSLGDKIDHIGHGMVRLPDGKMSSRTGKILTGVWLLDSAKEAVLDILKSSQAGEESQNELLAEKIGQSAIKYAFLKHSIGSDIEFNFDQSLDFQGNSGPYLMYTYVRCQSVLKKAQKDNTNSPFDILNIIKSCQKVELSDKESEVLKNLLIYSDIVVKSATDKAPHHLVNYLYQLAQGYNAFYNSMPILKAEADTREFRLAVTTAVAMILARGLSILNIKTVEKM